MSTINREVEISAAIKAIVPTLSNKVLTDITENVFLPIVLGKLGVVLCKGRPKLTIIFKEFIRQIDTTIKYDILSQEVQGFVLIAECIQTVFVKCQQIVLFRDYA